MSEYTPTTDQVRQIYTQMYELAACVGERPFGGAGSFDRWLAEHDQKVAAKTLMDAAKDIYLPSGGPSTYVDIDYAELLASLYLKDRAEQIEKGAGE